MTNDVRAELAKEFPPEAVQHFEGRGGKVFDYIEDETVMDRLDEVIGVGLWSLHVEPISVADGIVKVTLRAFDQTYEDFGYATRADGEQLKEAVSDGIRRCGRYLGIGRYLYKKHPPVGNGSQTRQNAPQRPPLRAVASTPASVRDDPFGPSLADDAEDFQVDNLVCAEHRVPWRGEPGDLYHKKADPAPGENPYCRHPANVKKPARAR